MSASLEVARTGPSVLVEDLGRPGLSELGVPASGAADRGSLGLANRLVGNSPGAAALEVLLGGLLVRARGDVVLATAGAAVPVRIDGAAVAQGSVLVLRDGQVLELGMATSGLRAYLAVRGGIDVTPVLGSRSTDTLSGIGPDPVVVGDRLPVGDLVVGFPNVDAVPVTSSPGQAELVVVPGPHDDLLAEPDALYAGRWDVSSDSDRTAIRLDGRALRLRGAGSLQSEGLVRGAVQVPPSGQPVLFLADHPVTGGYPVVGVVIDAHVDATAQLRPGQALRLAAAR